MDAFILNHTVMNAEIHRLRETFVEGEPAGLLCVEFAGDRIAAIGSMASLNAAAEIDAAGLVVAPGFIDVHNHSEGWLLKLGHLPFKTQQGFTTEVLMSDGISYAPLTESTAKQWLHYLRPLNGLTPSDYRSWLTIGDYLRQFEADETRIAQNVAVQIPYANVRAAELGWSDAPPTPGQMSQIQRAITQAMDEGAVGLSTGLDYISQCFASTDELIAAAQAIAPRRGLYATHCVNRIAGVQRRGVGVAAELASGHHGREPGDGNRIVPK